MLEGSPLASLLGMLAVIAAILVLSWWATKQIAKRPGLQGFGTQLPNSDFNILAQIPLGSQQRLVVVECAARYFLLGVTEHSISMLSELNEEEVQQWKQEQEKQTAPGGRQSFSALLQNKMRR